LLFTKIFFKLYDYNIFFLFSLGAVAQLVERMDGIHEVTGSIPVSSTTNSRGIDCLSEAQRELEIAEGLAMPRLRLA
jgi:hypothetical protein